MIDNQRKQNWINQLTFIALKRYLIRLLTGQIIIRFMKNTSFFRKALIAFGLLSSSISMSAQNSYIFLAPGVEEVEATATIDALRRAEIPVVTVAVSDSLNIKGATGQTLVADSLITEVNTDDADWLIVPGGDPGAWNLIENNEVKDKILSHYTKGGRIASICAGPAIVLAPLGVLKGKTATCYPGLGDKINSNGGTYEKKTVVVEPNLITSEGPGTTLPFAIEIIRATKGDKAAEEIANAMLIGQ